MGTATINGKPSVFLSLVTPTENIPIYSERVADFTAIAKDMAEAEAEQHTLCEQCQAEMVNWRLENPNATKVEAEVAHYEIWEQCPPCSTDYAQWCEEVDRQAEREANSLESLEHEAYEAHLEAQAEEAELARLGDAYLIGANTAHDLIWQQGGTV